MTGTEYRLYRINFVDRALLFDKPVSSDEEILAVFQTAANEKFDVVRDRPRNGYRWSVRGVASDRLDDLERSYIVGMFSQELTYRTGPIVQPQGVAYGTSAITPPMANTARFYIDLTRHLIALEDVPSIMQSKTGWQNIFQLILGQASHAAGFTSRVKLDGIAPRQVVEQKLSSFDRVTRLRVTLRIPNPDLGPTFKRLYDEMQAGKIRELTEDMRSERGLELGDDSLPRMALDMAVNGYRKGDVRIHGVRNGKKENFTLSDDVTRINLRNLRTYVEGMEIATDKKGEQRMLRAIIEQIDDTLGPLR